MRRRGRKQCQHKGRALAPLARISKFWGQTVRWTLRGSPHGDVTATVQRLDGQGEVLVDALDARGQFINFLDAQVGVVAPDRSRAVVPPDVALRRLGPTAAAWVEGTARPAARERETLSGRHDAWCGSAPVTPTGHQDQTQAEKIW
jgi:hypothetical protein